MYKNASAWAGVFFLAFSVLFFVTSFNYSYKSKLGGAVGAGFLPFWVSLLMIVASVAYIFFALKDKIDVADVLPDKEGLKAVALLFLYMVLFAVIVDYAGFIISNSLMLFLMFRGYFRWHKNLAVSVGISVFLFWLFVEFLQCPLPVNMFGW